MRTVTAKMVHGFIRIHITDVYYRYYIRQYRVVFLVLIFVLFRL